MVTRREPFASVGTRGDPDDHYDTWRSMEQGLYREPSRDRRDVTGASAATPANDTTVPAETSGGCGGTGLDRGYDPGKSSLTMRQTRRDALRDPWRDDVQPLSF